MESEVAVYVVGHSPRTGPVKIGYTDNIDDRLRCLRRGETCPLVVHQRFSRSRPSSDLMLLHSVDDGDRNLERHLHSILRDFRIDGEWFSLGFTPDEVIAKVSSAVHAFHPARSLTPGNGPGYRAPQLFDLPAASTPEPLTRLAEDAARHHEMFRAWIDAGFTEDQAMKLLLVAMAAEQQSG